MFFKKKKDTLSKRIDKANKLFDSGKKNEAFEEFSRMQNEFPDNADVLFGFAILQNSIREQASAIDILKKILLLNNRHDPTKCVLPSIIYEYAVQLSETGRKELARQYLLDFISLDNDNKSDLANGYKELAVIEESLGNINAGKNFIKKATEINEGNKLSDYYKSYAEYYQEILDRLNGS